MPSRRDDFDAACNEVERAFDREWEQLTQVERDQHRIVDQMLMTIDGYLQRNEFNFVTPAFTIAANLIAGETCHGFVWKWVRECIQKYPNPEWQSSLIITIIEPATEPPVRWSDMMELMKFLAESDWAEALFAAYDRDGFPRIC